MCNMWNITENTWLARVETGNTTGNSAPETQNAVSPRFTHVEVQPQTF